MNKPTQYYTIRLIGLKYPEPTWVRRHWLGGFWYTHDFNFAEQYITLNIAQKVARYACIPSTNILFEPHIGNLRTEGQSYVLEHEEGVT